MAVERTKKKSLQAIIKKLTSYQGLKHQWDIGNLQDSCPNHHAVADYDELDQYPLWETGGS